MRRRRKPQGLLQRAGVHMTQEDGEAMQKTNDATRAVLDSISTSSSTTTSVKPATPGNYRATSGRMF